ncbi:hypothetical protein SUGI_0445170 [Cryptomeria japonica]|nr:hypothetical protein SUGI_0445170 [Cryptomeria japonica]
MEDESVGLKIAEMLLKRNAGLVDVKAKDTGETALNKAIEEGKTVNMVSWLLHLSNEPESYFKHLDLPVYLRESSRMGYVDLVTKLLDGGADPSGGDDEGKTALHYAAEGEGYYEVMEIIVRLVFDKYKGSTNWEKASAGDKYGRNVLHVAAFLGRYELCRWLLRANRNLIDSKDRDGQSAIYYAVAGPHYDPDLLGVFISIQPNQVLVKDFSQTTPLHVAAARGKVHMAEFLLSVISEEERKKNYVEATDVLGQTALHKAASGGYEEIVKKLLEEGANPLKERDCDGKTALHFAAQAEGENAKNIAELLLRSCKSDEQRSLLLFASAGEIGLGSNSSLDNYLDQEKCKIRETLETESLLRVAARLGDIDMTREFITRGANISLIRGKEWIDTLSTEEEKKNVQDGEWGTGKSSVMVQTESILLRKAAQLAFTSSFKKNDIIIGASESKLSATGKARRRKIANAIKKLDAKRWAVLYVIDNIQTSIKQVKKFTTEAKDLRICSRLRKFLGKVALWEESAPEDLSKFDEIFEKTYQDKYHQIYKSLAVIDRRDMFEEDEESGSGNQKVGQMPWEEYSLQWTAPSILTVQYNAWHYRNETEAWAGLAVKITEEFESTMTVAHKLRTSCIYNWRNRRDSICLKVIFPFFLAVVVAIFLSIIIWLVLGTAHNKDIKKLKYGGLPASMIIAARDLGKSIISFVKPISSQVVDYICLPDHSQKLGYHQKLPLHLPDPSDKESNEFLQCQLGVWDSRKRSSGSAAETEKHNEYRPRKTNPKFQIGASIPEKPQLGRRETKKDFRFVGRGGRKKDLAESRAEQQRVLSISGRGETKIDLAESGAEQETAVSIPDTPQQGSGKTEEPKTIKKPERVSPITQIYRYIQKSLCNVRTNNSQSGVEEAKIEIEQPRKSDEQSAGDQEQRSLSLLISAMLIPNYTPGERKAFSILHTQCTLHRQ